jgi:hypothetical protein
MHRRRVLASALAVAVLGAAAFAFARGAGADEPLNRVAFLYVTGKGPQAKAWYDGAPPSGVLVQAALDTFTRQGYHYRAIVSSGVPGPAPEPGADYVILLER